jgi:hypothetical protein
MTKERDLTEEDQNEWAQFTSVVQCKDIFLSNQLGFIANSSLAPLFLLASLNYKLNASRDEATYYVYKFLHSNRLIHN